MPRLYLHRENRAGLQRDGHTSIGRMRFALPVLTSKMTCAYGVSLRGSMNGSGLYPYRFIASLTWSGDMRVLKWMMYDVDPSSSFENTKP